MKKINFLVALVIGLATVIITPSCKKYDEGPRFSLRSKKARVANTWKTKAEFDNGQAVPSDQLDTDTRIEFTKGGDVKVYSASDPSFVLTGTWEFADGKEDLKITYSFMGQTVTEDAKILKLKNDELWLETTDDNGNKTETHYEPA